MHAVIMLSVCQLTAADMCAYTLRICMTHTKHMTLLKFQQQPPATVCKRRLTACANLTANIALWTCFSPKRANFPCACLLRMGSK
jgi:hypothetical protein